MFASTNKLDSNNKILLICRKRGGWGWSLIAIDNCHPLILASFIHLFSHQIRTRCQADFLTRLGGLTGLHLFSIIKNEPRRREEREGREERYIYE